jgi:hypothetical protein
VLCVQNRKRKARENYDSLFPSYFNCCRACKIEKESKRELRTPCFPLLETGKEGRKRNARENYDSFFPLVDNCCCTCKIEKEGKR